MDDAGGWPPVGQNVDKLPGFALSPHHHCGQCNYPDTGHGRVTQGAMSSLIRRGRWVTLAV